MFLSINRIYVNSGMEKVILLNPRYILKIAEVDDRDITRPRTRLIVDSLMPNSGPEIIYTNESLASIKGKLTKLRKNADD